MRCELFCHRTVRTAKCAICKKVNILALNDSFIQELKFKNDIEDVVSSYVTLRRRGSTLVGLCPFHNEKTPSFTVYPQTQSFYCFGCGVGGDAVGFIRRIENLDYIDAIKLMAERVGMQMPQDGYDNSVQERRRKILAMNKEAARFYYDYMMSPEGEAGLNYFKNRGLTRKTIVHFGLGMAPDAWDALLKHLKGKGYTIGEMADAGLIRKSRSGSYIDTFRNRVMTPIIDVRGNVIAFGGRVLDDSKPKYVNTSDTLVYKKTNELFALNFAKDSGKENLILCEGYMDVIAMHQAGFTNAVAGCGTALTNEQVRLIGRYAKEVILAYDNDEAGQKATEKAISLFKETNIKIKVPTLKFGKDPDEIIKNVGAEKFGGMLEGATSDIEFKILGLRKKHDLSTTRGKADFAEEVIKILYDVNPVERDLYLSRIAEELGISKRSLEAQYSNYAERQKSAMGRRQYKDIVQNDMRNKAKENYTSGESTKKRKAEDRLLFLLMKYPDSVYQIESFNSENLTAGFYKNTFEIIVNRVKNGEDVDLMNLGSELTLDESSKLSGIIARGQDSVNPKAEIADCVKVITEEQNHATVKVSELSDDDFVKKMQEKMNKKRNGK